MIKSYIKILGEDIYLTRSSLPASASAPVSGFVRSILTVKMADKNVNITGTDADAEAEAEAEAVDVNDNVETGSEPDTASIERIYRYVPKSPTSRVQLQETK